MRIHQAVEILDDHVRFPSRCGAQRSEEGNRSLRSDAIAQIVALSPSGLEARAQTTVVATSPKERAEGTLDLEVTPLECLPLIGSLPHVLAGEAA